MFATWINTRQVEVDEKHLDDHQIPVSNYEERQVSGRYGTHFMWVTKDGLTSLPTSPYFDELTEAWKLGAYLICPAFQNAVMNGLTWFYSGKTIPMYNLHDIWETEDIFSPLRLMISDAVYYTADTGALIMAFKLDALPDELASMLADRILNADVSTEPDRKLDWHLYTCDYHVHTDSSTDCPCPEPRLSSSNRYDNNGYLWWAAICIIAFDAKSWGPVKSSKWDRSFWPKQPQIHDCFTPATKISLIRVLFSPFSEILHHCRIFICAIFHLLRTLAQILDPKALILRKFWCLDAHWEARVQITSGVSGWIFGFFIGRSLGFLDVLAFFRLVEIFGAMEKLVFFRILVLTFR